MVLALMLAGLLPSPGLPAGAAAASDADAPVRTAPNSDLDPFMPTSLAPIVRPALPAVVNISSTRIIRTYEDQWLSPFLSDPFFRHFFGMDPRRHGRVPRERREQSLGSGVIISSDGYVITNNHVVQDADVVQIYWDDETYEAAIVGRDTKTDVALLRIDAAGLPYLSFGDSDKLLVGDFVIAIGNPFGLDRTVTMGIVSAVGRADVGIVDYEDFIQTDAAINPGNSGGALLNLRGELVGINTAIVSRSGGYQGIGFAIPSRMAERVVESLKQYGEVRRGWLGIAVQEITADLATALEIDRSIGVLIGDVYEDSPGSRAGLRQGDIIKKVNGHPVRNLAEYRNRTDRLLPGMEARLELLDGDGEREVVVRVEQLPEEPEARKFQEMETSVLPGAELETLTPAAGQRFGYGARVRGVLVSDVRSGSPAAEAGLRAGDIIIEANRIGVVDLEMLEAIISRTTGSHDLLLVQRGRQAYYVAFPRS